MPADSDPTLSVVVIFHDMQREAERTLFTLSRAYQRDLDDLTYEVLAVDSGSSEPLYVLMRVAETTVVSVTRMGSPVTGSSTTAPASVLSRRNNSTTGPNAAVGASRFCASLPTTQN